MQFVFMVTLLGHVAIAAGNPVCLCTRGYLPVCGLDGNTYDNKCEMECKGVEMAYEGECEANKDIFGCGCICPRNLWPVCGKDGKTYPNQCEMKCCGVELDHEEKCNTTRSDDNVCICTREYNPVCGTDGHTYVNECVLKCKGTTLSHVEECKKTDPAVKATRSLTGLAHSSNNLFAVETEYGLKNVQQGVHTRGTGLLQ